MNEIISLSLSHDLLKELDKLQKEYNFKGRSETIRAAISLLISENRKLTDMKDNVDACVVVVHPEKTTSKIFQIMHQFQNLIKSQVHYDLGDDRCIEMFVLHGEARGVEGIARALKKEKTYSAKLINL